MGSTHKEVICGVQESSFRGKSRWEKKVVKQCEHRTPVFKMLHWEGRGAGGSVYSEWKQKERFLFSPWERFEYIST